MFETMRLTPFSFSLGTCILWQHGADHKTPVWDHQVCYVCHPKVSVVSCQDGFRDKAEAASASHQSTVIKRSLPVTSRDPFQRMLGLEHTSTRSPMSNSSFHRPLRDGRGSGLYEDSITCIYQGESWTQCNTLAPISSPGRARDPAYTKRSLVMI
jgi:hypothetical protein